MRILVRHLNEDQKRGIVALSRLDHTECHHFFHFHIHNLTLVRWHSVEVSSMSYVRTDVLPGLSTNKSWHSCRTFCNSVICLDSSCAFDTSSLISYSLASPLVTDMSPGSSTGISWENVYHHAFNCFPFPVRLQQITVINLRYLLLSKQAYNIVYVSFQFRDFVCGTFPLHLELVFLWRSQNHYFIVDFKSMGPGCPVVIHVGPMLGFRHGLCWQPLRLHKLALRCIRTKILY